MEQSRIARKLPVSARLLPIFEQNHSPWMGRYLSTELPRHFSEPPSTGGFAEPQLLKAEVSAVSRPEPTGGSNQRGDGGMQATMAAEGQTQTKSATDSTYLKETGEKSLITRTKKEEFRDW
jgi:hypothetical protein